MRNKIFKNRAITDANRGVVKVRVHGCWHEGNVTEADGKISAMQVSAPPLLVDAEGMPADLENAIMVLVGEVDFKGWRNIRILKHSREKVMVYASRLRGHNYAYAPLHGIGVGTQTVAAVVMSVVLGHSLNPMAMDLTSIRNVLNIADESDAEATAGSKVCTGGSISVHTTITKLADQFSKVMALPVGQMTAWHHKHINEQQAYIILASCSETIDLGKAHDILERVISIDGVTRISIVTFAVYISTLTNKEINLLYDVIEMAAASSKNVKDFNDMLKATSAIFKQAQHGVVDDMVKFFELNVLLNRGIGAVDWEQERRNRMNPRVVEADPRDVYDVSRALLEKAKKEGVKYRTKRFIDWVEMRLFTVPGGAAHSGNPVFKEIIEQHKKDPTFNKKKLLAICDELDIESLLARKPRIEAWPSIKYEWGTERAIYGTDVDSYILADMALGNCEHLFPSEIVGGANMEESRAKKIVEYNLDGLMPLCFDYEDFNSQHSIDSMSAVLRAFRDTWCHAMSVDQHRAIDWTIESVSDMQIHGNSLFSTPAYNAKGTLLSGWRLTTFINSMLNYIYLKLAGSLDHATSAIHAGDDVLATVLNVKEALSFTNKANGFGIRAQRQKTNIGSVAEFLRIDHKGQVTGSQYLTRACATLVHARMESTEAYDPADYIEATKTRFTNIGTRGGRCNKELWEQLVTTIVKTQGVSRTNVYFVLGLDRLEGGICVKTELSGVRMRRPGADVDPRHETKMLVDEMRPGILAAARAISRKLAAGDEFGSKVAEKISDALAKQMTYVRRKLEAEYYVVTAKDEEEHDMRGMWDDVRVSSMASVLKGVDRRLYKMALMLTKGIGKAMLNDVRDMDKVIRILL